MRRARTKKGFTLVELSLSIAFISILSITIALIINDAISTYRRGLTLNQINTVGMDIVDDIRTTIQNSPSRAVVEECLNNYSGSGETSAREACEDDKAQKFVTTQRRARVGGVGDSVPVYGAFCTGLYSYIWNSGYFYSNEYQVEGVNRVELRYKNSDGVEIIKSDFRLLKIKDQRRAVCASRIDFANGYVNIDSDSNVIFDISSYGDISEEPEVLLAADNINILALYDLSVAALAVNDLGNTSFYSLSFILGTVNGGINVMSSGNFCKAPYESNSYFDYCAINKFNFAAQAIGG